MQNSHEFSLTVEERERLSLECEKMADHLAAERIEKINNVLSRRRAGLSMVMEGLTDPHNISASMRASEALGIQEVHVVMSMENRQFTPHNAITSGAHKWLDIKEYHSCVDIVPLLKERGFKIYVSAIGENSVPMEELEAPEKVALVFGNEKDGVSKEMMQLADKLFWQPFPGFTQVLNVSVATALCLQKARDLGWGSTDLNDDETLMYRNQWYRKHFKHPEKIIGSLSADDTDSGGSGI